MDKFKIQFTHDGQDRTGQISDGYHTFNELYEHLINIFIALCKFYQRSLPSKGVQSQFGEIRHVWRSLLHSDGTSLKGWFIMGINSEKGKQITYHLPNKYWSKTKFADTLSKAPEFDGHTSEDVLSRLKKL